MLSQTVILSLAALVASASAQVAAYGQCGGTGYSGGTTCVAGYTCTYQNAYYSQCLASTGTASTTTKTSSTTAKSSSTTTSTSTKATTTTSKTSTKTSSTSTAVASSSGTTSRASFTEYGSTDDNGSGNCNTLTTACGFYTYPGYSAAVSQNEFGVGPGAGAGPACGTCWKLVAETDSSGNALANAGNSIVVQVTNLCPADGNPLCAQNGLSGTNQYGANLNFDLCIDSGASAAMFGSDGAELAVGTAVEVSCSEWTGTVIS
ncbi:hypothetical protein BDV97DRAFT_163723 [Delphinella strobiligena]|nr:hypothetical protein BDV97DRAFT_163723 [Delphinella strobiligena]